MLWENSTHRKCLEDVVTIEKGLAREVYTPVSEMLNMTYVISRDMGLSLGVFVTTCMYLSKYYLFGDRQRRSSGEESLYILSSALYLSIKVEDEHIQKETFISLFGDIIEGVSNESLTSHELAILEAIDFNLKVHSPFNVLEVFITEVKQSHQEVESYKLLHSLVNVLVTPPLIVCFPPQILAAVAICIEYDNKKPPQSPLLQHLVENSLPRIRSCMARYCQSSIVFSACKESVISEKSTSVVDVILTFGIASYLSISCLQNLRFVSKTLHTSLRLNYWSLYVPNYPTRLGHNSVFGFHKNEIRFLKQIGMRHSALSSSIKIPKSHHFSDGAIETLIFMNGGSVT